MVSLKNPSWVHFILSCLSHLIESSIMITIFMLVTLNSIDFISFALGSLSISITQSLHLTKLDSQWISSKHFSRYHFNPELVILDLPTVWDMVQVLRPSYIPHCSTRLARSTI